MVIKVEGPTDIQINFMNYDNGSQAKIGTLYEEIVNLEDASKNKPTIPWNKSINCASK